MLRFRLRELLRERGISERQFAHQTGIREGTLYQICNNDIRRLSFDTMAVVCNALDVTLDEWIVRVSDDDDVQNCHSTKAPDHRDV